MTALLEGLEKGVLISLILDIGFFEEISGFRTVLLSGGDFIIIIQANLLPIGRKLAIN